MNTKKNRTVVARWDSQDSKNEGWYAEVRSEDGDVLDTSMSPWFPVDLDGYTRAQWAKVRGVLETQFPGAVEVVVQR